MVKSALKTIIFTDYRSALRIAKQTSLSTLSTAKLNLRLIRASEYIQQFRNLEFRHKPGKKHVVPDTLSRLSNSAAAKAASRESQEADSELDALYGYVYTISTLVELSPELRQQLLKGYRKETS